MGRNLGRDRMDLGLPVGSASLLARLDHYWDNRTPGSLILSSGKVYPVRLNVPRWCNVVTHRGACHRLGSGTYPPT